MGFQLKKWWWTIILVFLIAIVSLYIGLTHSSLTSQRGIILTFWLSFFVGMIGAGVYLCLLLMTEKNLPVLKNGLIQDISFMTWIFLLSGGSVAAITQTSSGVISSNGLQSVFMIGFGWQGALAGVASTGARAELNEENSELRDLLSGLEGSSDAYVKKLENQVKKLKAVIESLGG